MARFELGLLVLMVDAVVLFISSKTMGISAVRRNEDLIYRFSAWSIAMACLAALLGLVATLLIATDRHGRRRLFALLSGVLALCLCILAYGTATDRLVISPRGLLLPSYGFPAGPHVYFSFGELDGALKLTRDSNRAEFEFFKENGSKVVVPVGTLTEAAMKEIVRALELHKVPFVDMDD